MSLIVLLDAGPLGMITNPKSSPENEACKNWLASLAYDGVEVVIPEVADYEVRRELLRAGKERGIGRLDALKGMLRYAPITTPVEGPSPGSGIVGTSADPAPRGSKKSGDGWKLPPNPMPPDTPEADQAWAMPRRLPQPIKTFEQPLRLKNGELTLPRHYIYCKRCRPDDGFRRFYERAKQEGWGHGEIDASHNPNITVPEALAVLLHKIAA